MDEQRLFALLERMADALEALVAGQGALHSQGMAKPAAPGQPTFAGYACSWQCNDAGFPSYILDPETGELAQLREKQGDRWYSVKTGEDEYRQLIRIAAGETLPPEAQWRPPADPSQAQSAPAPTSPPPSTAQAQPSDPDPHGHTGPEGAETGLTAPQNGSAPSKPSQNGANGHSHARPQQEPLADDDLCRRLHEAGRGAHGADEWPKVGPQLIQAYTDGRTSNSRQMRRDEAQALIEQLQGPEQDAGDVDPREDAAGRHEPPAPGQTLFDGEEDEDDEALWDRAGAHNVRQMNDLGLQVFKHRWLEERPRRVLRITEDRTQIPEEMTPAECAALTNELQSVRKRKGRPAYAG